MSDEADALRGKRAQEVLDNEVYADSYASVEAELINKWRDSRNPEDREQLHQFLMMLGKVQNALETVMRTGEVAAAEIARKRSKAEQIGDVYTNRWAA
ncbi:hypothetical protein [Pseudoxanthomonas sp. CF125]|uniref:hypothetical protein n=1 Tax=Pseudoxanthomonas sp. CF125 TaxID=1855303 RepID=UPI00088C95B2|nr:hypothetical protein [Pseudoxanthomonas sp. CF125]SDQ42257.1 hypothetical protein SAMN05216569_1066 [Pseudoxanthomonas sp. CF125]